MVIKLKGRIFDVGGQKPNVWIELEGERYLSLCIDEESARLLGEHLYKEVTIEISIKGLKEGKKE